MVVSSTVIPPNYRDGKTGRLLSEITSKFKYQSNANTCLPNGLYNILNEISRRLECPDIGFSEEKINKITLYKYPVGPISRLAIPNLNKKIKPHNFIGYDKPNLNFKKMINVLKDKKCSYPLLDFPYRYLVEKGAIKQSGNLSGFPDHVVILLFSDDDNTIIYDPYMGISSSMRRNNDDLGKGIVCLSTSEALSYWEDAFDSSCMIWIKRETNTSEALDKYMTHPEEISA